MGELMNQILNGGPPSYNASEVSEAMQECIQSLVGMRMCFVSQMVGGLVERAMLAGPSTGEEVRAFAEIFWEQKEEFPFGNRELTPDHGITILVWFGAGPSLRLNTVCERMREAAIGLLDGRSKWSPLDPECPYDSVAILLVRFADAAEEWEAMRYEKRMRGYKPAEA